MRFDYDQYRRVLLWVPLGALIFFTFCILGTIIIAIVIKNPFNNEVLNNFFQKKFVRLTYVLLMSLFFVSNMLSPIGHLKYGIFLKDEKPEDALVIQGEIEEIEIIKNPDVHTYKSIEGEEFEKYTPAECDAHLITMSGNDYYFMIKGYLMVGDYVKISYLPKSTIVLEVTIIYQEELTIN